ncbi:MAG: TetR/AcrR family transcriptional regulator [Rubrivivax sp.]|nr:TetR/AcrR family transcriptional regulator [Rubrivivax sp.]
MLAPSPTRLPTEERQAEIVAAALQLAREASPPLITTADIAAVVGVSQGAVFKHFPTKDAIWVAVMAWVGAQMLAALEAAARGSELPLDALDAVFRAHLRFVVAHPGVPRVIFHELQEPQDTAVKREVRALLQAYRQLLLRLLDAAARRGDLAADLDPEAAATLFVGMVQGLVMQAMTAGRATFTKARTDCVYAIYLRGISRA